MNESKPKRKSPCVWIERDAEGRPRCEHGWARVGGTRSRPNRWCCRASREASDARTRRANGMSVSANCVWIERDEKTGRPRCMHGWAYKSGRKRGKQIWACRERKISSRQKDEESLITTMIGGRSYRYRVRPEKKEELQQRIAEFRYQQVEEYRDAREEAFVTNQGSQ